MKITVGTDIIEVKRIEDAFQNSNFRGTVFTENEIKYCESKKSSKYQHYAARFAAKEAVFKAISKYLKDKFSISWKNVEIINDEKGKPYVHLLDVDIKCDDIDISLSHIKDYAIANAIIVIDD